MVKVNVMVHDLVPEHTLLSPKEEETVLKAHGLGKSDLPKIKKDDPCIKILEALDGPIEEGRVIKIVRKSDTAGKAVVYRVVIRG